MPLEYFLHLRGDFVYRHRGLGRGLIRLGDACWIQRDNNIYKYINRADRDMVSTIGKTVKSTDISHTRQPKYRNKSRVTQSIMAPLSSFSFSWKILNTIHFT